MNARTDTSANACTPAEVEAQFTKRFTSGGTPRSESYQQGFRAALNRKLLKTPLPDSGIKVGTCKFDAYHSGFEHGLDCASTVLSLIKEAAEVAG